MAPELTKDWERFSKARLELVADSLLEALSVLEIAAPKLPADVQPPIYYPREFDMGMQIALPGPLAPCAISGTTLILDGWDETHGTGSAQIHHHRVKMVNGVAYGHLTFVSLDKRKRKAKRQDVDFRWLAPYVFDTRALDGSWHRAKDGCPQIQFALDAYDAVEMYGRKHPLMFLALDNLAIQVPCSATFARRLLSGRDKKCETGRRAALRHFVDHYFRDQETKSGDDEVWVRKHLRGAVECAWGGFTVLLRPPADWQEEHEEWVEARDAYRNLSPEDRAAARDLIRSTYGLKPRDLNGAMNGD